MGRRAPLPAVPPSLQALLGAMPGAGSSVPALHGTVPAGDIPCRPSRSHSSVGTSGKCLRRGWVRAWCSAGSDHDHVHVSTLCSCHARVATATLGSLPGWSRAQPLPILWDVPGVGMPQSHLPQQPGGPGSGPKVQPPLVWQTEVTLECYTPLCQRPGVPFVTVTAHTALGKGHLSCTSLSLSHLC